MKLEVYGKLMDTSSLKNALTQGENNVDIVTLRLPAKYEGKDISSLTYVMRTVNAEDIQAEAVLEKSIEEGELTLSWAVTGAFTATSGEHAISLIGCSPQGEEVIKFNGANIYVAPAIGDSMAPLIDLIKPIPRLSASARYENGTYYLDILDMPKKLPENYTVTFIPPTNVKSGDSISINGVEHIKNYYGIGYRQPCNSAFPTSLSGYIGKGYFRFANAAGAQWKELKSVASAKSVLAPSTIYTTFLDISQSSAIPQNGFIYVNSTSTDAYTTNHRVYENEPKKLIKQLLTTKPTLTDAMPLFRVGSNGSANASYIFENRIMLLKGDYTDKELPAPYWENVYGEYKIMEYGITDTPIKDGAFAAEQPVTLHIGLCGAFL